VLLLLVWAQAPQQEPPQVLLPAHLGELSLGQLRVLQLVLPLAPLLELPLMLSLVLLLVLQQVPQ
jgi:hypothetical protein